MLDRFGDAPKSVMALLDIALLRADAAQVGICDISQKGTQVIFRFGDQIDVAALMRVCAMNAYRSRLLLSAGERPHLTLQLKQKENALSSAAKLVEELRLQQEKNQGQTPAEGGTL